MEFETKYITEKECEKLTTLSRPTRWRLARKGLFPEMVAISPGRKAYYYPHIMNWIEEARTSAIS